MSENMVLILLVSLMIPLSLGLKYFFEKNKPPVDQDSHDAD